MTPRSRPGVPGRRPRVSLGNQAVAVVVMTGVWNLLWGTFSWGNLVGGFLLALLVLVFFPLPALAFRVRIRPLSVLWFLGRFAVDLVLASVQVAAAAVRPGRRVRNALIAVPLRVRTDLNLTLVAEALSLIPGSIVVDVRPSSGTLYVHILGVKNAADVRRAKENVASLERRLVWAVGSRADRRRVLAGTVAGEGEGDRP